MHLELVELLRCPRAHEHNVLVAASDRTAARYVMEGVLGCPDCGAEYPIHDGVAQFGDVTDRDDRNGSSRDAGELALRVAAQLAMTEGRAVYGLIGFDAAAALRIRDIVPARLILVNCNNTSALGALSTAFSAAPAGVLRAVDLRPLAPNKFDGIAFAALPSSDLLTQAVGALKSSGRLVAPAWCPLPSGVSELVRDSTEWVATRNAVASAPVGISRR